MKPQPKLEQYLKQASRGIWGKKKLEVMSELRGNIESRVWMLEQQGFSSFQALEMALDELGKPNAINAGMVTVHSMPKTMKAILVAAMLSSLAVVNVNLGTAQVAGAAELPINQCSISKVPENFNLTLIQQMDKSTTCIGFWFKISDLKTVLEPLGITYERQSSSVMTIPSHVFTFPGNNKLVIQPASTFQLSEGTNPIINTNDDSDAEYIPGSSLFSALSKMNVTTSIEGFEIPKITIGSLSFTFGTTEKPINALNLYSQVFQKNMLTKYFPTRSKDEPIFSNTPNLHFSDEPKFSHFLKVKDSKPGTIYLILYRSQISNYIPDMSPQTFFQPYRGIDVSPMFKTEYLIYHNPIRKLEYTTNPEDLDQIKSDSDTGKVMLLKFTGTLNNNAKSFEVVPANQITEVKYPGR
jgi:hypothetical protein